MIKFIKIAMIVFLVQSTLLAVTRQDYGFHQGVAYVHTVRNSPVLKTEKSVGVLKKDTLIYPKNLEIKCDSTQKAFIVFSNRTVIEITPESDIAIKTYEIARNNIFDFAENHELEKGRSRIEIELREGKLRFLGLTPRPTSSFQISTKFGTFDIKSSKFIVSLDENKLSISILNGSAMFKDGKGKEFFIKGQQYGKISLKAEKTTPLQVDYITTIENDSIEDTLRPCKMAFETVEFTIDKNGKNNARRIVPKDFLNRLAK